jgi:hypothetical protein
MLNTVAVHHDVYSMMMHLQVFQSISKDQGCGEPACLLLLEEQNLPQILNFVVASANYRRSLEEKTMVGINSDGQTIMLILIHASDALVFVSHVCVVCSMLFSQLIFQVV